MRPRLLRPPFFWSRSTSASCGPPLCRLGSTTLTTKRRPGEVGFTLTSAIVYILLYTLRGELQRTAEFDIEAGLQFDVCLFAVFAAVHHLVEALGLAQAVHRADVLDLDGVHLLDGLFDLGLFGIARHLKDELAIAVSRHRALLGVVVRLLFFLFSLVALAW